ncbi:MAG: sodium/solute symporter [Fuerstiella sp.]|nr:sodium/solute symporter [Fuerstiella sp.]
MATTISSMTFLAIPGATFKDDWRFVPASVLYVIPAVITYRIFMPFFRRGHIRTAYEYLERRFGSWARLYGATAFLFYHGFGTGIILYAVSLPFQRMSGFELTHVICGLGVIVAIYTIAGGLQAVIYTDCLQGFALIAGGLICTPIIANMIPGGLSQIFSEAWADGKLAVGSTSFRFDEKTVWVIILTYQFSFLQFLCTDQTMVQRYLAVKTDHEARRGFLLGAAMSIPAWVYFSFVGTALYVFYKHFPTDALNGAKPEEVFPYFILTQIPAGVAGFVLTGMLAAAMSTLDSNINASAAILTNDIYRPFRRSQPDSRHLLLAGRLFSILFSIIMVTVALTIHFMRTETLMNVQTLVYPIVTAGLLSLFLLGFLTVRVGSTAALVATVSAVLLVAVWTVLTTEWGTRTFPNIAEQLPDAFWIGVLPHLFLLASGYGLSWIVPRRSATSLQDLTIWTRVPAKTSTES